MAGIEALILLRLLRDKMTLLCCPGLWGISIQIMLAGACYLVSRSLKTELSFATLEDL